MLAVIGLISGVAAFGLSFLIEPAYRSTVVLMPARDESEQGLLSSLPGALGGLAGLAGISLGGSAVRGEALEFLRSAAMARAFIEQEKIGDQLSAVRGGRPSPQRTLEFFRERVLDVTDDKRTNVIRVSMTWQDPAVAARWANRYVAMANARLQARAVKDAAERRAYLERELQRTGLLELRAAAYRLIESQLKVAMLAATREEFAFQVIDPAVEPDRHDRVRPKRSLLAVVGTMLGSGLALLLLWLKRERTAVP